MYICKRAFIYVHHITASKIRHLTDQMKTGSTAPHPCQRGRHRSRPNRQSSEEIQQVINHINFSLQNLPIIQEKKKASRLYLSSTLSIEKIYTLYYEWLKSQNNQTTLTSATLDPAMLLNQCPHAFMLTYQQIHHPVQTFKILLQCLGSSMKTCQPLHCLKHLVLL